MGSTLLQYVTSWSFVGVRLGYFRSYLCTNIDAYFITP
jgi:hypothetical protein